MHEYSLACNILEIVEENAQQQHATKVSELTLEIGSLAGVELQALQTAIESLQNNSILEGTIVNYQLKQAQAKCLHCQFEFEPSEIYSSCPKCNGFGIQILSGKELIVKSMVIE
jgi:hydrogenase nickel incorporation protein HypA/HybF